MLSRLNMFATLSKMTPKQPNATKFCAQQLNRYAFSTENTASADPHFIASTVTNGIVMFDLNRPRSRNALSR